MNDFYIKIIDGQPSGHPIAGSNLRHALNIDTDNLPSDFLPFERVPAPTAPFESFKKVLSEPTYQIIDGIVKDVWLIVDMTDEEKSLLINAEILNKNDKLRRSKELSEFKILNVPTEDVATWQQYLDELNTLEMPTDSNPYDFIIPPHPRKNPQGQWMTRSEIEAGIAARDQLFVTCLRDGLDVRVAFASAGLQVYF